MTHCLDFTTSRLSALVRVVFVYGFLCRGFRVETVTHGGPSVCQKSFGLDSNKQRIYLFSFLAVIFMLIKKHIWSSSNKAIVGTAVWLLVENTNNTSLFNTQYILIPSFKKSVTKVVCSVNMC